MDELEDNVTHSKYLLYFHFLKWFGTTFPEGTVSTVKPGIIGSAPKPCKESYTSARLISPYVSISSCVDGLGLHVEKHINN